ncbi:GNAT family N-acetyltransferase, partial [Solemya velum gill symbiont]|uniref:GNAT family N-acetyltransferase n=1 Tax=Solemya velum gill symbiont TaxID=2340 RepID=UPI00117A690E
SCWQVPGFLFRSSCLSPVGVNDKQIHKLIYSLIARYVILHDEVGVAEFAITVLDDYQGQGIGYELIKILIGSAKANDVNMLIGHIAPGNKRMLNLCKRFDASIQTEKSSSVIALISVKNDYS